MLEGDDMSQTELNAERLQAVTGQDIEYWRTFAQKRTMIFIPPDKCETTDEYLGVTIGMLVARILLLENALGLSGGGACSQE
jgi:hypothetical protein